MQEEKVYPYRANRRQMIWVILFFAVCAAIFVHEARTYTAGKRVYGIIKLWPEEAASLYWGFAVMSAAFVLIGIFGLYNSFTTKTFLTLGSSSITVPAGLRRWDRTITYADIKTIQHRQVYRQEFLKITPGIGRSLSINASMLPSKDVFTSVRAELTARAKAAQNL